MSLKLTTHFVAKQMTINRWGNVHFVSGNGTARSPGGELVMD